MFSSSHFFLSLLRIFFAPLNIQFDDLCILDKRLANRRQRVSIHSDSELRFGQLAEPPLGTAAKSETRRSCEVPASLFCSAREATMCWAQELIRSRTKGEHFARDYPPSRDTPRGNHRATAIKLLTCFSCATAALLGPRCNSFDWRIGDYVAFHN